MVDVSVQLGVAVPRNHVYFQTCLMCPQILGFPQSVDAAVIPSVDKTALREELALLGRRVVEFQKVAAAANKALAAERAVAAADAVVAAGKAFVAGRSV